MSKSKIKYVEVLLTGITHKGNSVGRTIEGEVIFAQGGVPGDRVTVGLHRKRKGVWTGQVTEILDASVDRVAPICEHFGVCGGCSWQNLSYAKQLELKEQVVIDAIMRMAKLKDCLIEPILKCDEEYYYRNKLEYTFSNRRWLLQNELSEGLEDLEKNALGFHRPGIYDKIVDINKCHLQIDLSNQIRNAIKSFAIENNITFYDVHNHSGFLRNLIVKTNEKGQALIVLSVNENDQDIIKIIFSYLKNEFATILSAYCAINTKKNDSWHDLNCIKIFGEDYLVTNLNHAIFCIGPKSFFQTNRNQTENLYALVEYYAELQPKEVLYDLYCGVGSIGIYLANKVSKVIGIEEIPEAIEDANLNAKLNHLTNCTFFSGDVLKILSDEFIQAHGQADIMIVDPPRTGLHSEVIEQIIKFAPRKIVYVSCNPATAARDLQLLNAYYNITKARPVDMFPMTNHIEMVAQLIRK